MFVGMAGLTCGITLLFLGMRSVMNIGGFCASGGPYRIAVSCPHGVTGLILGGVWGGLLFGFVYTWQSIKLGGPTLVWLAWPALFLSLGYNFLQYAFDPPVGHGPVIGWLIPGVLFILMGGVPLAIGLVQLRSERAPPYGSLAAAIPFLRSGTTRASSSPLVEPPSTPAGDGDVVEKLERLAELHRRGDLTAQEYEGAKESIIRSRDRS